MSIAPTRRYTATFEALDALEDNIVVLDGEGTIVAENRAWRAFADENGAKPPGRTGVGTNYLAVCKASAHHPREGVHARSVHEGLLAVLQGRAERFQSEYPCDSFTEKRWFRVRVTPLPSSQGVVVVHENLTLQRSLENELRQLQLRGLELGAQIRSVIDGLPALVGYWDRDLVSRFANEAHAEWFGKPIEQLRGLHMRDMLGDELFEANRPHMEAALRGEPQRFAREFTPPGVPTRWIDVAYTPHRVAGEIRGFSFFVTDISEQKRAEHRAIEARDAADLATRAKSQLLATMSHEVRTPLNGILGSLEVLLATPLTAEQAELVETSRASGQALAAIVDDLLNFSKLEAGMMTIDLVSVDLRHVIEVVCKTLALGAKERGVELETHWDTCLPTRVLVDPLRVRQLLGNLVGNALKFTARGGRISVRTTSLCGDATAHRARVAVHDSGIGVPRDVLATLFQPFVQGDSSTTRKYGGTGLGLSICKRLAERMGGVVGAESEPGVGSCFWFELSLQVDRDARSSEAPPPQVIEVESARRIRSPLDASFGAGRALLLVDDNRGNQLVGRRLLAKLGFQVDVAADGQRALQAARRRRYDAVLMDCQMPVLDGYDAARALRGERLDVGPIIAMTANALDDDRDKCLAAGMDDYVAKPLSAATLREALARQLPARRLADAPPAPVFDEAGMLARLEGDRRLARTLVRVFLGDAPVQMQALADSVDGGDLDVAERLAHALKGAAAIVGGLSLVDAAHGVEQACGAGDLTLARERFVDARRQLARLEEALPHRWRSPMQQKNRRKQRP